MASATPVTDHDRIRDWAEEHGGRPACVKGTAALLRIDFGKPDEKLQPITWDDWFQTFEESNLAALLPPGSRSRFFKLVDRNASGSRSRGGRAPAARGGAARGRKTASARGGARKTSGGSSKGSGRKAAPGRKASTRKSAVRKTTSRSVAARGGAARKGADGGARTRSTAASRRSSAKKR